MSATDLFDLCGEWLAACEDAVTETPGGAISYAYVAPGSPPFDVDCGGLLTVHAGGPAIGDTAPLQPPLQPGHRVAQTGVVHLMQLTATVLRCSPAGDEEGDAPSVADWQATSLSTTSDVWAIWNFTKAAYKAGTLFPSASGTRELFFDPASPVNILGGAAGWQIPIRVALYGYTPDLP